jgi:hypothetical protein
MNNDLHLIYPPDKNKRGFYKEILSRMYIGEAFMVELKEQQTINDIARIYIKKYKKIHTKALGLINNKDMCLVECVEFANLKKIKIT